MGVALCRAVNRTNEQGVETGMMESEGKEGTSKRAKLNSRVNNATRPGIGVSAETLGRTICTQKASSARCTGKKVERRSERKKRTTERKRERTVERGAALGTRCLYHRVTMAE